MSKAVLVIDMPDNCLNCPLYHGDFEHRCKPTYKINHDFFNKPDWCPLQQMPEKSHTGKSEYYQWGDWEDGWNACIDGLLPE